MIIASCIVPTRDRRAFIPRAIALFRAQDMEGLELLILDDGVNSVSDLVPDDARIRYIRKAAPATIGEKRNLLCAEARGEFIVHWDDDDWYPPDRVRRQLEALRESEKQVSGTSTIYYHDPVARRAYRYAYVGDAPYVTGNSLAYRRSFWERTRFAHVQVGEDTRFVRSVPGAQLVDLKDPALCVATIHASNASPKRPGSRAWQQVELAFIQNFLRDDHEVSRSSGETSERGGDALPLVSCIMPTGNRRAFVEISLELFAAQDYPQRELIVVDGGESPVADLCEGRANVRYVRAPVRSSIGARRNLACMHASGDVVVHWDDDDWYAPGRIRAQVTPILSGQADITGLYNRYSLELRDLTFWTMGPDLHRRMFEGNVHGGTLAFRRRFFEAGLRYPEVNLAEDAALLRLIRQQGGRLVPVENPGTFVYMRHDRNAWSYEVQQHARPGEWKAVERPDTMTEQVVMRYRAAHESTQRAMREPRSESRAASNHDVVDALGGVVLPPVDIACQRCIAFVVTDRYADMLDAALTSLARHGDVADALRVVLAVGPGGACARVAHRHGASVVCCTPLRSEGPALKSALYAMAHVVKAQQYLCLDADVLVTASIRELFERHAALPPGRVLVAPEASQKPLHSLGEALTSMYAATSAERHTLTCGDASIDGYPIVINDGVFVADRRALLTIDATLRARPDIAAWVHAHRRVWWRQKAALNLALAYHGAAVPLDRTYNVQLHVERTVPAGAKILHFNGAGRRLHGHWPLSAALSASSGS